MFTCVSCGKKGPPLAPLVRVPSAVGQITARRVADQVMLTLVAPTMNVDQSTPVALGRVEVYGYTGGTAPPPARFPEVARLVATIELDPAQGVLPVVRDELSPDELVAGPPLPRSRATSSLPPPAASDQTTSALKRFYMAVAFSDRGRAGPPSPIVELPLTLLPDPPEQVTARFSERGVILDWAPSGGLIGFLLEKAPFPSASPLDDGPATPNTATLSPGPTRYNVYRQVSGSGGSSAFAEAPADRRSSKSEGRSDQPGTDRSKSQGQSDQAVASQASEPAQNTLTLAMPSPVNPSLIEDFTFSDQVQSDGQERCYTVTAIRESRGTVVEGRPSKAACVAAVDVFPPAAPRGVSPIAAEGSVSLVWEANKEPDLAGYFVWRGEVGQERLVRITDQVVAETRFTDETVRPGVRYVYAVTALDQQSPQPNVSSESERVEVTAR